MTGRAARANGAGQLLPARRTACTAGVPAVAHGDESEAFALRITLVEAAQDAWRRRSESTWMQGWAKAPPPDWGAARSDYASAKKPTGWPKLRPPLLDGSGWRPAFELLRPTALQEAMRAAGTTATIAGASDRAEDVPGDACWGRLDSNGVNTTAKLLRINERSGCSPTAHERRQVANGRPSLLGGRARSPARCPADFRARFRAEDADSRLVERYRGGRQRCHDKCIRPNDPQLPSRS